MFYEPDKRNHGLRYNPFKALVVPRPIGWISSVDLEGRPNLAPYSMFNAVASEPPCVMFASSLREGGDAKDSRYCAEATGDFVVNLATYEWRAEINTTSATLPGDSPARRCGVDPKRHRLVRVRCVIEVRYRRDGVTRGPQLVFPLRGRV